MNFLYLLWFNILGGDSDSLNEDTQMTGHWQDIDSLAHVP